jgi:hypothetical protein
MDETLEFETVFAGSPIEASLVQNFLEERGIAARLADEFIGTTAPHIAAGGGAGAVKVQVASAEAGRAREILALRAGASKGG